MNEWTKLNCRIFWIQTLIPRQCKLLIWWFIVYLITCQVEGLGCTRREFETIKIKIEVKSYRTLSPPEVATADWIWSKFGRIGKVENVITHAVGIFLLLLPCIQIEIYVISYLLPVTSRHLWFLTNLDTRQCLDQSSRVAWHQKHRYIAFGISLLSCIQAEIYVISYPLPVTGR